jgi:arylsulfatase A-like enzyme
MRFAAACLALAAILATPSMAAPAQHNVVLFIADGLRYSNVTPETAPTLWKIKSEGVDFTNSHSIYPTLTTANASAIATGHYLGDTGDYGNTLFVDFPVKAKDNSNVTFLEDDAILAEMKQHFGNAYLGQTSLAALARAKGINVAVFGKVGPAAIQDITLFTDKGAMVIDDAVGTKKLDGSPAFAPEIDAALAKDIATATGLPQPPAISVPNDAQEKYLTTVEQVVLRRFKDQNKPFLIVFWSRDPDATQHVTTDSPGALVPGVNGPMAHSGIADADKALKSIIDGLDQLGLSTTTDIFVTADHGFSTIAKSIPDSDRVLPPPSKPQGFVAIDVSRWLGEKLFDPDAGFSELDYAGAGERPARGNGTIGDSPDAPDAIVAANGGSDLIYARGKTPRATAKKIFDKLIQQDYTGVVFVNDALLKHAPKDFAGALPMSAVNLIGSSKVPNPSIVLGFRSFDAKDCALGEQLCAVELADTSLQTGQGMHGTFSRADTHNFMAAIGPDFKKQFADPAPISNADINPTLGHILGVSTSKLGHLSGRAATEALAGGRPVKVRYGSKLSDPAPDGERAVLEYQQVGQTRYFDAAGFPGRTVGLQSH